MTVDSEARAFGRPIVIVGVGQMGSTFAHAFLRAGYPVFPVNRGDRIDPMVRLDPLLVLVAVGEPDLHPVLDAIPPELRERVMLLQNELLPRDWRAHGLISPTVASIWFEKKVDKPLRVLLPTVIAGSAAKLVVDALGTIGIAAKVIEEDKLVDELVLKNLYILTTNIAGLKVGGTTGPLVTHHRELVDALATEVLLVQRELAPELRATDDELRARLREALLADPDHGAKGRSAAARLRRLLELAAELGVETPTAEAIAAEIA